MNSDIFSTIRARATTKIDLARITHEQAVHAILDRALLVADLENSWWANIRMGLIYIGTPTLIVAFALWWYGKWWWLALGLGAVLLNAAWLRDVLLLAAEGRNARMANILGAAVQAPTQPAADDTQPEQKGGAANAEVPLTFFGE